jgi:hypothetical protein
MDAPAKPVRDPREPIDEGIAIGVIEDDPAAPLPRATTW